MAPYDLPSLPQDVERNREFQASMVQGIIPVLTVRTREARFGDWFPCGTS